MLKTIKSLLAIAVVAVAIPTQASVIDFNSMTTHAWFNTGTLQPNGWTLNHDDFAIANTTTNTHKGIVAKSSTCGPACPDNGSNYLLAHGAGFKFTSLSNSPFSLFSFDGAEAHMGITSLWATSIKVTGEFIGGGSITQTFALDFIQDGTGAANDFQTFTLSGFNNLASLSFDSIGGGNTGWFSIDNLNISSSSVPESSSLALFGLGLVCLGLRRRTKK